MAELAIPGGKLAVSGNDAFMSLLSFSRPAVAPVSSTGSNDVVVTTRRDSIRTNSDYITADDRLGRLLEWSDEFDELLARVNDGMVVCDDEASLALASEVSEQLAVPEQHELKGWAQRLASESID